MRPLAFILFLLSFTKTTWGQDTAFLVGNVKHCGDSVVLRWNAEDPLSFHHLIHSKVIIEKKTEENGAFQYFKTVTFKNTEHWNYSKNSNLNNKIVAASSVNHLIEYYKMKDISLIEQLNEAENANFYFSNVALYADFSAEVANLMGLRFCDKTLKKESVAYKIYLEGDGFLSDTVYLEGSFQKNIKRKNIETTNTDEFENGIQLNWKTDASISAYHVQKFNEKSHQFENINQAPIVYQKTTNFLYFKDSVGNYKIGRYRIVGIDLFADTFAESSIILASGRDKTPPGLLSGLKAYEKGNQLVLTWKTPQDKSDIKYIAVGMRHNNRENFKPAREKALSAEINQLEIPIIKNKNDYYFIVQVYDTAGNYSINELYYQLHDVTAPEQPIGLDAKVDSLGVVTLKWRRNHELDLGGYLIYTSNSKQHEFSGLMNVPYKDTIYYDTLSLKMLNREVYYRIVAVDNKMNRSKSSDIVKVLRPDTLKPVSPIIKDYSITDTSISIVWLPSSSLDVKEHFMVKRNLLTQKTTISIISIKDSINIDKDVELGQNYEYSLYAMDENGNASPLSNKVIAQVYRNDKKAFKQIFVATYDSVSGSVQLQWEQPGKKVARIVVYKGTDKNQLSVTPFKIPLDSKQYLDSKIKHSTVYFYALQIYYADGSKSEISDALGVIVP